MFTKGISVVAAAITAAVTFVVTNPSIIDTATNYPKINRDYISYSTEGETVVCGGSVNQDMFRCQTTVEWGSKENAHNLVTFDLEDASGSWDIGMSDGNWNASHPPFRLKEGKKYSFHGIVIPNKDGILYFSSPYHEVRGEVTPYEWEVMETDWYPARVLLPVWRRAQRVGVIRSNIRFLPVALPPGVLAVVGAVIPLPIKLFATGVRL